MAARKQKRLGKLFRLLKIGLFLFFGSSVFFTLLYRFVPPPLTPLMLIRCGQQIMNGEKPILKKDWVSIDEISPRAYTAVIATEDNLFMEHFGFDLQAIQLAHQQNLKGKKLKGGSTITQQTAKNLFLWPKRSYFRKGLEAYFTLLLEIFWTKERIIEVYLNIIEMGKGIYGFEMAAQHYYGISAKKLSSSQAAILTAILPSPIKRNPLKPTPYLLKRQAQIMKLSNQIGTVSLKKSR